MKPVESKLKRKEVKEVNLSMLYANGVLIHLQKVFARSACAIRAC